MRLVELDIVDGSIHDCVPQHIAIVESFDELKNEHHPEANAFVLLQHEGVGHACVTNTIEDIGEAIRRADPLDWFEATTKAGNRTLLRRSLIVARRSLEEGSLVTLLIGGTNRNIELKESVQQLRETMNSPTLADAPPGLQLIEQ